MGCLADSFPSFTLFCLYHRRSTAWMGLGRASSSYCCHFGVFGSHPAAVSGVIWSGGATPITYASAPLMATQSPAATLPVQRFPPMTVAPQFPPNMNTAGLGMCLSPGSEPVPQKLVDKVCSGAYVDMKELVGDNISLLSQLESLNIAPTLLALPGSMKPRLREVSSLASWLYCFLA